MVLSGEGEPEIYVSNARAAGCPADALGPHEGLAVLVARRLAHHLRHGARPAALRDVGLGRDAAARDLRHEPLLRGAGLEPGLAGQGRLHDDGRAATTRSGSSASRRKGRAGLQGALRRHRALVAAGRPPPGLHRAHDATSRVCILDTETGKSTPSAPRGSGPPSRRASGRASLGGRGEVRLGRVPVGDVPPGRDVVRPRFW
jgi:hypothetical protein